MTQLKNSELSPLAGGEVRIFVVRGYGGGAWKGMPEPLFSIELGLAGGLCSQKLLKFNVHI